MLIADSKPATPVIVPKRISQSTGCHWKIPELNGSEGNIINIHHQEINAGFSSKPHLMALGNVQLFFQPQRLLIQIPQRMTTEDEKEEDASEAQSFWVLCNKTDLCLNLRQGMRIPLQTTPKLGIYPLFVQVKLGVSATKLRVNDDIHCQFDSIKETVSSLDTPHRLVKHI